MEGNCDAPELTILLRITRRITPGLASRGPLIRVPRRKNSGALRMSRMVMPVKVMSSTIAPSSVSSAKPWQLSKTQLEMVMLRKPPFDSVPNLMRPVDGEPVFSGRFHVPSSTEPSANPPVT